MAAQEVRIKLDPGQVSALKQFVRDEIRGERAAVSTPLEGWYEATTVGDLAASRRVFIRGANGDQDVHTDRLELERLRNGVRDLLRDVDVLIGSAHGLDRITIRLQELLK